MSSLQELISSAITAEKNYRASEIARQEREAAKRKQQLIDGWELAILQKFPQVWSHCKDTATHINMADCAATTHQRASEATQQPSE